MGSPDPGPRLQGQRQQEVELEQRLVMNVPASHRRRQPQAATGNEELERQLEMKSWSGNWK